jgi:hypothetical protein
VFSSAAASKERKKTASRYNAGQVGSVSITDMQMNPAARAVFCIGCMSLAGLRRQGKYIYVHRKRLPRRLPGRTVHQIKRRPAPLFTHFFLRKVSNLKL